MGTRAEIRARPPLGSERPPWMIVAAAALCAVTVIGSVLATGFELWQFRNGRSDSPFFALPDQLFARSSWVAVGAYFLIVVPWSLGVLAASVRLLYPHRAAHVSLVTLLVPALALDLIGYVAVIFSGQPISAAHLPFGLWFVIGVVICSLLSARQARQFEARLGSDRGQPWSEDLWDDGT